MRVAVIAPQAARKLVWLLPAGSLAWPLGLRRSVYRPDAAGCMVVRLDHVPELLRQGCTLASPLTGSERGGRD